MPPPQSKVWLSFQKKDNKVATCKLCFKEVKFSGNTSNLMKHLKTHHKNVSTESSESISKTSKQTKLSLVKPTELSPTNSTTSYVSISLPSTSSATTLEQVEMCVDYEPEMNQPVIQSQSQLKSPIIEAFSRASAFSVGGIRYAKIVNSLLYFICKDNRPFAVIEGEGFKHLMHELAPMFKIPSVKFIKSQLNLKYEALSEQFKTKLKEASFISISTDVWTETMAEKAYLGVTAHFLDGVQIISVDLACKQLHSKHTSAYLSAKLKEILAEWEITTEKVVNIVTDNGANIVAAAEIALPKKHLPCFAHTLNLVTTAAVTHPEIVEPIKKVRNIVKFIKNSVNNSDKLRQLQLDSNIPEGNVKKMVLDVRTRWNSTFYMIQRFLELLSIVSQILVCDSSAPEFPTGPELADLRQLEKLLKPFEFATTEISSEKYVSISKIIPMVNCLTSHLHKFDTSDSSTSIKTVKRTLDTEINKRFGAFEQNSRLALSTLLDPRFKTIHFQNPVACGNAVAKLKAICKAEGDDLSSSEDSDPSPSKETFDFWQTHKELAQGKKNKSKLADTSEMSLYLANQVSPLKTNPLEVWEDMKNVFPALYKQARKNLLQMGTSVPCERLFSKAGATMTEKRNRLSAKFLDKIVFLSSIGNDIWFQ